MADDPWYEDAWDWTKGAAGSAWDGYWGIWEGAGDWLGLTDPSGNLKGHMGPGGPYAQPFNFDEGAFDPQSDPGFQGVMGTAGEQFDDGSSQQGRADGRLMDRDYWQPPSAEAPDDFQFQGVHTTSHNAQVNDDFWRDTTGKIDGSRQGQQSAADMYDNAARGFGPSVAGDMQEQNASRAAAAFRNAGSHANQGYQNAATQAGLAYDDAVAQQQYETLRGGQEAARAMQRGNADAIQRQGSLFAQARGDNMAMALRNAQNNAALQTTESNAEAANIYGDAVRDASFQAAGAQRQASANEAQEIANLQATAERAAIEAARAQEMGDIEAARIASEEQQRAMEMLSNIYSDMRQGDLQERSGDLDFARFGLDLDNFAREGDWWNVSKAMEAHGMNTKTALAYAQMNGDWQTANNVLMADIYNDVANRGMQISQQGLEMMADLTVYYLDQGMELEMAKAAAYDSAMSRGANFDIGAMGGMIQGRGQNMEMAGGIFESLTGFF